MSIDIKTVERTAELSRLYLSDSEKDEYAHQLSDILDYVETINSLDTDSVEATDHVVENSNVFREDVVGKSLKHEDLSKNAPRFEDGFFVVPKIIE